MDLFEEGQQPKLSENMVSSQRFFVLDQVKDCPWQRLRPNEWQLNLGPDNVRDWAKLFKPRDAEGQPTAEFYVRINYLVPVNNSLKALNQRWGKRYREQAA